MANSKSTVRKAARGKRISPRGPISHVPGRGLMVSTRAQFPESADEKIIVARSIVLAVVAAHDAGAMEGENYDIHWPLHMAINLLEQASSRQLGVIRG
jgi:hypothetical protein